MQTILLRPRLLLYSRICVAQARDVHVDEAARDLPVEVQVREQRGRVPDDRPPEALVAERGRVPPGELFRPPHCAEFGAWDAQGVPLADRDGKELSKSASKKVQKEWAAQKKRHEEFLAWQKQETAGAGTEAEKA